MNEIVANLPLVGLAVGIPTLVAGFLSIRFVWQQSALTCTARKTMTRSCCVVSGCILAVVVMGLNYFTDARTHVFGFPFLSYVFQKRGGLWLDFLGPLTIPALIANAFIGFSLPFMAAALFMRVRRRRGAPECVSRVNV